MIKNGYLFFFGKDSPLSQWHKTSFIENGIEFTSAEQYMMYAKALLFNDKIMADKVLKTDNPKQAKKYGRQVHNFDTHVWNAYNKKFVYIANYLKFTQNPELKKYLFDTKGLTLVEASPYDRIWGIGLSEKNPKAWDKSTWRG